MVDMSSLFRMALRYIIEGFCVSLVAVFIPKRKLDIEEVVILGLTAAGVFCLLDNFSPTISNSARSGAGMGLGFKMVGFPA